MLVKKVRLQNFRAFLDTGSVAIKPITLLVGRNSIGKSTFGRLFPLLRQSVSENKRGPILWYGKHADFGSFRDVLNRNARDGSVTLTLELDFSDEDGGLEFRGGALHSKVHRSSATAPQIPNATVSLRMTGDGDGTRTHCEQLDISLLGVKAQLNFSAADTLDTVQVGNQKIAISSRWTSESRPGALLPRLAFFRNVTLDGRMRTIFDDSVLREPLWRHLRSNLHGNVLDDTVTDIADAIPLRDITVVPEALRRLSFSQSSWYDYVRSVENNLFQRRTLIELAIAARLPELIESIDWSISQYFSGVRHVEPLRASAQRYYRRQELSVDEIDSTGSNLAVFLDSLSETRMLSLNQWLEEQLAVRVRAEKQGGHVLVRITDLDTGRTDNMADMGFGFSQILPVAIQAWASVENRNGRFLIRRRRETCLVFEQPELHLHPAMQARVGDMLVAVAKSSSSQRRPLSMIIETHSSHLISRIGDCVAAGALSPEEIQIVTFEQLPGESNTSVKTLEFDGDGSIREWPFGFLDPQARIQE